MNANEQRDEIYRNFRAMGKGLPPLDKDREWELVNRRDSGDETAAHELALSSVNFIISLQLRKFPFQSNVLDDALMAALVETLRAAESFDPSRGSFLNQVALEAKGSFIKTIQKSMNIVHLGSKKTRQAYEIRTFRQDYLNETGDLPTDEEVSSALGLSWSQIADRDDLSATYTVSSVVGEDGSDLSVLETVACGDHVPADVRLERAELDATIQGALDQMPHIREVAYQLVVVAGLTLHEVRDIMKFKYHNSVVNHVETAKQAIQAAVLAGVQCDG